tara:strand:+ start:243 stop:512 length:270 start_codon:yes stop_codon:yes gene_type:complete
MLLFLTIFISISFSNSNNSCIIQDDYQNHSRTVYAIGDTLTIDDQNTLYPVCNGSGNYQTGDLFSFTDLNGDLNGGDYKITIISMNATW